mmetsp:Transcript_61847/g.114821  ORF Transcript_61847/g.114821 Transcript_61847/m.114821 type:complete len:671 (+) Transcript_61847:48-2060(+)
MTVLDSEPPSSSIAFQFTHAVSCRRLLLPLFVLLSTACGSEGPGLGDPYLLCPLGEHSQCVLEAVAAATGHHVESVTGAALLQSGWGTARRQPPTNSTQGEWQGIAQWLRMQTSVNGTESHWASLKSYHFKVPWARPVLVWSAAIVAVTLVGAVSLVAAVASSEKSVGIHGRTQWGLITASFLIMMNSGSVYAMGAWQDELRDALGLSMEQVTAIGASTFLGILASTFGGFIFDNLGPRCAVALGGTLSALGYLLIGLAVVATHSIEVYTKIGLAGFGSLLVGYSSVSLMDNIVCMACTLSFPTESAAVVGLLKAALATAAGLWALLWVHVFQGDLGLAPYLATAGFTIFIVTLACLPSITIVPSGQFPLESQTGPQQRFTVADKLRFAALVLGVSIVSCFDVSVSFLYSKGRIVPHEAYPCVAALVSVVPVIGIVADTALYSKREQEVQCVKTVDKPQAKGDSFTDALFGLDFWLLFFIQYAIFGAGIATNQNLALIMESAGAKTASGLGVALFALTSALSRMGAGILSDSYPSYLSRLGWITSTTVLTLLGLLLVSIMSLPTIMAGVLLVGLSFGAFYTVFPPVVKEMYGARNYGKILMTQLCCQAVAALTVSLVLLPLLYRHAAGDETVCVGAWCFRTSFLILAVISKVAVLAAWLLQRRRSANSNQ